MDGFAVIAKDVFEATQQNPVELYFRRVLGQLAKVDVNHVAFADLELLATVFDYCVHFGAPWHVYKAKHYPSLAASCQVPRSFFSLFIFI